MGFGISLMSSHSVTQVWMARWTARFVDFIVWIFSERSIAVFQQLFLMEGVEERLAEQASKYPHLYNASLPFYKDAQVLLNSWREISKTIGLTLVECKAWWKKLPYVSTSSVTRTLSTDDCSPKYKCRSLSGTFFFWQRPFQKYQRHKYKSSLTVVETLFCNVWWVSVAWSYQTLVHFICTEILGSLHWQSFPWCRVLCWSFKLLDLPRDTRSAITNH